MQIKTRQGYIEFYTKEWGLPCLPLGPDKKPLVSSWSEFQNRMPTSEELERCKTSWGITFILKDGYWAVDPDILKGWEFIKPRIVPGSCYGPSPHGHHILMKSNGPTETLKGTNQAWIACLERIDPSFVEVQPNGMKKAKIDILGTNSLLHSADSPGYSWDKLYAEPVTINFAEFLYDCFGYVHRFNDIRKPGCTGNAIWIDDVLCPFCEGDGKYHKTRSGSINVGEGSYKCHSCDKQGRLTDWLEQARKAINFPIPQAALDWEAAFRSRQSQQVSDTTEYGPPQTLKQFMSNIELKPPLITGLANRGELIMPFGETGIGKSSFLEYIITCACAGVNIADIFLVLHPLKCLFIDVQMAPAEVGIRFETLFSKLGGEENFMIKSYSDFDIVKPQAQAWLYDTVKAGKYDIVVFDPLEDIHHLNEKDNFDMSQVVAPMRKVANELNCAVFVGHHTGGDQYDNQGNTLPKKPRGATAITDRMDTIIEIIKTNNELEKIIHFRKMRKALVSRQSDIILKYDPETLLMSLGGPAAIVKAYQQGAKDRYQTLSLYLQIKGFGLTDAAMAGRLGVGRSTITRYGSGTRRPDADMLKKMGDLLKKLQEEDSAKMLP